MFKLNRYFISLIVVPVVFATHIFSSCYFSVYLNPKHHMDEMTYEELLEFYDTPKMRIREAIKPAFLYNKYIDLSFLAACAFLFCLGLREGRREVREP